MYPVLFTIPGLDWPISSFGAMMATAFLVGYWIAHRRMQEEGLDPVLDRSRLLVHGAPVSRLGRNRRRRAW